jgi:hypothetical protein
MDFSQYKFVVSSGCSYGRLADYVFGCLGLGGRKHLLQGDRLLNEFGQNQWLDIVGDKIVSLNLSLGSQGSDWQADSLIYAVEELLKLGVKSENIFCLVEWSQWHRFSVHPPHHYDLDLNVFNFRKSDEGMRYEYEHAMVDKNGTLDWEECNGVLDFFRNHLKLSRSNLPQFNNVGKIEDRIYMTIGHSDPKVFEKLGGDYKLFFDDMNEIVHNFPLEIKIKTYLDNILRTQYFLEKNNLSYNFCFMQSTLSEWGFMPNGVMCHPVFNLGISPYPRVDGKFVFNPNFNPVNDINSDIENIMPEIKSKIDQLNFNNFWFYETERFRRGGIDEWVIDNMKETGYVNLGPPKLDYNFNVDEIIPSYGDHPNLIGYILLWNKIAFNCGFVKVKPEFENFLWEKYLEDYNHDGISKYDITISKKEWNRIFQNNLLN